MPRLNRNLQPDTNYAMREPQVLEFVPFSRAKLWRDVRAGLFPKPYKIGARVTVWNSHDVFAWLAKMQAANGYEYHSPNGAKNKSKDASRAETVTETQIDVEATHLAGAMVKPVTGRANVKELLT